MHDVRPQVRRPRRNSAPASSRRRRRRRRGRLAGHKERQIAFFDQDSVDDFGITRPRGTPELYGWLLEEKFRRSIIGLEHLVPGSTVFTICGGSGIDAEFLGRRGGRVIPV